MSAMTFCLRPGVPFPVDCSFLLPERLAGRSRQEIEQLALAGSGDPRVGDLFQVGGDDTQSIIITGDGRLAGVGRGMKQGTIVVEGDAGDYAGDGMRGGRLVISGSAGAFAGTGMSGGRLEIAKDAGAFLGGARPGERRGMRGGFITVAGNAGDRVADRMRRGLIVVNGNAGSYCASGMIAGTVLVRGAVGVAPGFGLKRGTLLLERQPQRLLATFQDCGTFDWLWLSLLEHQLRTEPAASVALPLRTRRRRYCGDLAEGGAGEILIAVAR